MKPRFVLIDEEEKQQFEVKWQLPYGFSTCAITTDEIQAHDWLGLVKELDPEKTWVIVQIDDYGNQS
jgi:hypothetical protein